MKSIVTLQFKGSNFKTSLSGTLAHMYADQGKKVLLIDTDHQANLTIWLTGNDQSKVINEFADVMADKCYLEDGIVKIDNIDLLATLPSTGKIIDYTENTLPSDQHTFLDFKDMLLDMGYDYVIYDLSPSFSLLNRSILLQADTIFTPISPEFFSLVGLTNIFNSLDELAQKNKRVAGVQIPKPIIAISGHNESIEQHNDVVTKIEKAGVNVACTMPVDPIYRKAQSEGVSIFNFKGSKPKAKTVEGLKTLVEVLA